MFDRVYMSVVCGTVCVFGGGGVTMKSNPHTMVVRYPNKLPNTDASRGVDVWISPTHVEKHIPYDAVIYIL